MQNLEKRIRRLERVSGLPIEHNFTIYVPHGQPEINFDLCENYQKQLKSAIDAKNYRQVFFITCKNCEEKANCKQAAM
jgi:hypothetical protein